MNLKRLSDEEILKIKSDYYNMEQLLIYIHKLEKAIKIISEYIHKSNTDKNWNEIKKIIDKIIEYI